MQDARQAFWKELNKKIKQRPNTPLQETSRSDRENDSWRSQRHLTDSVGYSFNLPVQKGEIQVYLVARRTRDRERIFEHLSDYRGLIKSEFEREIELEIEELDWRPDDGKYKIILRREADIVNGRRKWDEYQKWLIDRMERLYFTTGPILVGFDAK